MLNLKQQNIFISLCSWRTWIGALMLSFLCTGEYFANHHQCTCFHGRKIHSGKNISQNAPSAWVSYSFPFKTVKYQDFVWPKRILSKAHLNLFLISALHTSDVVWLLLTMTNMKKEEKEERSRMFNFII